MAGRKPGGPKTGGRKKGVPNKSTAIREADIRATGLVPMDYYLAILRNENESREQRNNAADKLLPFCHARLASVEASASVTMHESVIDEVADEEAKGTI
jgi:hypothetical protein